MLSNAGLTELVTRIFEIDIKSEAKGITPKNLSEYFGYGLYIGKK